MPLWTSSAARRQSNPRKAYPVDPADGSIKLVQVCASLADPETRTRELRALDDAMQEVGVDRATLVTLHAEETVGLPAGEVRVVPAWRWLLEADGAGA